MDIILASGSPRRKQLLEMLGVKNMKVIPAVGEEKAEKWNTPGELVMMLASQKGSEVAGKCGFDDVVIAADTVVWVNDRVFGKPHSEDEAYDMLRTLSGNCHEVYTGVWVKRGDRVLCRYEVSRVHFRELSDSEIRSYISNGEPMDKAGAYGAQGLGALFVSGIQGDFFNVMGLPLCTLGEMLKEQGVGLL